MRRLLQAASWLVIAGAVFAACEPPPQPMTGASCVAGEMSCTSVRTVLVCVGGRMQPATCGGPRGCSTDGTHVACDESEATPGDACFPGISTAGAACAHDKKSLLSCAGGRFDAVSSCKGPKGCYRDRDFIRCDSSIADLGEPCMRSGAGCSSDGQALLVCTGGRYVVEQPCHGPKACSLGDVGPRCDDAIADVGDACKGGAACSLDMKKLLKCADDKRVESRICRGTRGCTVADGNIRCDESIAEAGDACDEGASCTADRTHLLECKDGVRVVARACPKGCEVHDAEGTIGCH